MDHGQAKEEINLRRLRDGEKLKHWEHKEVARQFQSEDPGWEVVHAKVAGSTWATGVILQEWIRS